MICLCIFVIQVDGIIKKDQTNLQNDLCSSVENIISLYYVTFEETTFAEF